MRPRMSRSAPSPTAPLHPRGSATNPVVPIGNPPADSSNRNRPAFRVLQPSAFCIQPPVHPLPLCLHRPQGLTKGEHN
jgi:hypothetical protein